MATNKELNNILFQQLKLKFNNDDKSRIFLDQKLAILIAQVAIYIGCLTLSYSLVNLIPLILAVASLFIYAIGIWPVKIHDIPGSNRLYEIMTFTKDDENYTYEFALEDFVGLDQIECYKKAFQDNEKMLNNKELSIKLGIAFNFLSVLIWVISIIILN